MSNLRASTNVKKFILHLNSLFGLIKFVLKLFRPTNSWPIDDRSNSLSNEIHSLNIIEDHTNQGW